MLSALVSLVTGMLEARAIGKLGAEAGDYADKWFRLIASVIVSSYVTGLGTWGLLTGVLLLKGTNVWVAFVSGFASALLATACVVANLWKANPLTKGISLAIPSQLAAAAVDQDVTITTRS